MKKILIIISLLITTKLYSQITRNESVISYIKVNGRTLSPDYNKVCCTDFLIKVLSHYYKLSPKELQQISINLPTKEDKYNFGVYIANMEDHNSFYNDKAVWGPIPKGYKISTCCGMADIHGIYIDYSKGVVQWAKDYKKGVEIRKEEAIEGDLIQFWYPNSYGHCGILKSIDLYNKKITLYSSFPSTHGYGIQEFDLSPYTYFARLK